jgi:IS6 family transposase
VAAERTRNHPLRGPLVSSIFLSLRDVEELLIERGLGADHTTVWRWVQRYAPGLEQRMRRHLKSTNRSWRVYETYIRIKGRWCYLDRAIDSAGATIDFLLSALRDPDAAKPVSSSSEGSFASAATRNQYGPGSHL